MIARYDIKEISDIWSEHSKFQNMLKVEISLLKALEAMGRIPKDIHLSFHNVKIDIDRIKDIEKTTRHDVIAFCTSITEQVPQDRSKFFHFGVTSSDILDTALSLQLRLSLQIILEDLKRLQLELKAKIDQTKDLLCIGRSHGMYAEPMIFAQKFLSFYAEFQRRIEEYSEHITNLTGQFSGAVGNYTVLSPELEELALKDLDLKVEPVSSQIISRDKLAKIIQSGSLLAASFERLSTEIRLLHHSDVGEVAEGFKFGQKGSSTMPHKKNPISSENVAGLCRVLKSHSAIALENCHLWHERDISHSSSERIFLPDHFCLIVYICRRVTALIRDLEINREHIEKKAFSQFSALSSLLLHEMILINQQSREEIYEIIQNASFKAKSLEEFIAEIKLSGLNLPQIPSLLELKQMYMDNFNQVIQRTIHNVSNL